MGSVPFYGYDYGFGYNYGFDYAYSAEEVARMAGTLFLVTMGIFVLAMLFACVSYVMTSYTTYTIAMRRGIKHPWLAWIPYGDMWILGSIADQYQYVARGQVKSRRKVLLGLQIAGSVLAVAVFGTYVYIIAEMLFNFGSDFGMMDVAGIAVALVIMLLAAIALLVLAILIVVFRYISLYNLFASCWPSCSVAFILLSIFLPVIEPFLIFACRKKDLGMPPRKPKSAFEVPVEAIPQPVAAPAAEPVVEIVAEPEAAPAAEVPEEPTVEAEPAVAEAPAPEEMPATEE